MRRTSVRALLTAGAVTALATAGLSAPPAHADGFADTDASPSMLSTAYGVSAGDTTTVDTNDQPNGAADVPPTPGVEAPENGSDGHSVASVDGGNLLSAGEVTVNATADPDTATDGATSTVNAASVSDVLSVTTVRATCDASPTSLVGSSLLNNLNLAGHNGALDLNPPPNKVIDLPGIGTITLNEQTTQTVGDEK